MFDSSWTPIECYASDAGRNVFKGVYNHQQYLSEENKLFPQQAAVNIDTQHFLLSNSTGCYSE